MRWVQKVIVEPFETPPYRTLTFIIILKLSVLLLFLMRLENYLPEKVLVSPFGELR